MNLQIDTTWTLFLDRDGVINTKIDNDYIRNWSDFKFVPGVFDALKVIAAAFSTIVVVTNQQGIGKGFFTEADLAHIHQNMQMQIRLNGGRIDKVYFCPNLVIENSDCRKPNTGMGLQAKRDFPAIDFSKSIMVGDSMSDMQFGKNLGMTTVFISETYVLNVQEETLVNYVFPNLYQFAKAII